MTILYQITLIILGLLILVNIVIFLKSKVLTLKIQSSLSLNTLCIMFLSTYLYNKHEAQYLDITLLYAILSYSSILAFTKYYKLNVSIMRNDNNQKSNKK